MKDGKSVEVINTNDKNVLVDQSEKPAMHRTLTTKKAGQHTAKKNCQNKIL